MAANVGLGWVDLRQRGRSWCRRHEHRAPMKCPGAGALSLPNLLTYGRIVAVPLLVLRSCSQASGRRAVVALGALRLHAASITDFLDGYFARTWEQQSAIGQMLDPIADKLLVAAAC